MNEFFSFQLFNSKQKTSKRFGGPKTPKGLLVLDPKTPSESLLSWELLITDQVNKACDHKATSLSDLSFLQVAQREWEEKTAEISIQRLLLYSHLGPEQQGNFEANPLIFPIYHRLVSELDLGRVSWASCRGKQSSCSCAGAE